MQIINLSNKIKNFILKKKKKFLKTSLIKYNGSRSSRQRISH